jgi:hypothetical protein
MKNIAILGGLVLLATDTKGAPSMTWRVKKTAKRTAESLSSLVEELGHQSNSRLSTATENFHELAQRFGAMAVPLLDQARSKAPSVKQASRAMGGLEKRVGEFTGHFVDAVVEQVATLR